MHGPHASTGGDKSMLDTKRAERRPERRPRRNSDTSIMDSPLTEEERKLIETRRRERERRHREKKEEGKEVKDPTKKPKRLDLIDQLDATSIYGTGLFHHDGPFDALNPHRNRGGRRAPMQAFPEGSLNNSLGGSGPLNARPDHATFMGHHDDEAHKDYNFVGKDRSGYDVNGQRRGEPIIFDPSSRGSVLHGDESIGLGTSTFLEGTPAARAAIQRREQEQQEAMEGGGLQRKKSLAQRIRGMNRPPRDYNGRFTNPEATYGPRTGDSAGERNPFFDEFDKDSERITVKSKNAGPISPGSADGGRSPGPYGLERRATSDSFNEAPAKPQGGGFLGRMKSLKGGKRQRPEVPPHASPAPPLLVKRSRRAVRKQETNRRLEATFVENVAGLGLRGPKEPRSRMKTLYVLPEKKPFFAMAEGAHDDERPPPQLSQASSHFPLEPVSGSTLFDVEVARREQLHRRGTLVTGCGEIDGQVLGGRGFERGSVVGISAEHMDTGLLIGLQTIAHSLLANLGSPGQGTATGQKQQPSLLRAAVITTLPAPTILPHLRDVIKVQARLKLGGPKSRPDVVDAIMKQCLERISVSRVFDIEGLWEVLSELESAAAAEDARPAEPVIPQEGEAAAAADEEPARVTVPAPGEISLPALSQRPPPPSPSPSLPPVTKLPPLRMRTEVQDSEEEDELLSSSPLSSLRSTPSLSPETMEELVAPLPLPSAAAPNPQPSSSPPVPPETTDEPATAPSPPAAALSQQQSPTLLLPPKEEEEQEEPTSSSGLPDIILITHTSSLFSAVFTARDKTSAHTSLQLLSSHLRYLSRSAGPLIILLNITSLSTAPSTTNPAQPPRRPDSEQPRPLDPTLRSIFNPPPPSHLGYAAATAHALSRKNKPAFGQTFAQFLDLHLLCTKVPRSREDAEMLFSSTSAAGRQQRPVHYAWVVETLADGLGAWEWEGDAPVDKKGTTKEDKKWKAIDREQRWGAVEIRNAGCQVVDSFDTTRNTTRPNTEPMRLAAGFGGRRV
ncbi:hypothetical protein PG997_011139 [Apiospora hydei]|uniref:Uncharacterized protein n=1 Tax=Apiospora hydei TaxID=1337664 RepID=A0ABR1VI71_9PEZI